ncbi:MAG: DNA ligase [Thaumarchaeota archaeon]|nr:DNA ligase [Nitrososphaerota archaeon]
MSGGTHVYVVHKHKATALHYDFRLEIGGAMPSWSIPKGPTLDPTVRRLAMPTGPHDLEYRHFEGTIPSGYGAGTVMIWDQGTYAVEAEVSKGARRKLEGRAEAEEAAEAALRDGNLKFTLYGAKLLGSFALVRTKGLGGTREAWLLIKHRDDFCQAGYDANDHDLSAETDRTLVQIAQAGQGANPP